MSNLPSWANDHHGPNPPFWAYRSITLPLPLPFDQSRTMEQSLTEVPPSDQTTLPPLRTILPALGITNNQPPPCSCHEHAVGSMNDPALAFEQWYPRHTCPNVALHGNPLPLFRCPTFQMYQPGQYAVRDQQSPSPAYRREIELRNFEILRARASLPPPHVYPPPQPTNVNPYEIFNRPRSTFENGPYANPYNLSLPSLLDSPTSSHDDSTTNHSVSQRHVTDSPKYQPSSPQMQPTSPFPYPPASFTTPERQIKRQRTGYTHRSPRYLPMTLEHAGHTNVPFHVYAQMVDDNNARQPEPNPFSPKPNEYFMRHERRFIPLGRGIACPFERDFPSSPSFKGDCLNPSNKLKLIMDTHHIKSREDLKSQIKNFRDSREIRKTGIKKNDEKGRRKRTSSSSQYPV